jgi:hypothetical protein
MKDLRLEERFIIETEEQGVHLFDVYIEHENTVYFIEGTSTVNSGTSFTIDEKGTHQHFDFDFVLDIDEVYSGIDCEHNHCDKSLLEGLKSALYTKIHTL